MKAVGIAMAVAVSGSVVAAPVAEFKSEDGVVITATNEPCRITEQVSNLPMRATWKEGRRVFEGCYGIKNGIVLMFFEDKSVVFVPGQSFTRMVTL